VGVPASPQPAAASPESTAPAPESQPTGSAIEPGEQAGGRKQRAETATATTSDDQFPDRPWDENITEPVARYIEDRITQRLEQFFERELRPWMDRIEHELKNGNGNGKHPPG
jgi:hypothetical protein